MNTKVYLSKAGVMSAAGNGLAALWDACLNADNSSMQKTQVCTGNTFYAARITKSLAPLIAARFDMHINRICNAALLQIKPFIEEAIQKYGKDRVAVCVGSCDNGSEFSVKAHRDFFKNGTFPKDYALEAQGAGYTAAFIREEYGTNGPAVTLATACSSGASAIARGADLIRTGVADACIAGGVDIASDTVLLGFNALGAVSEKPTNPFSKNRSGITLGDGAAFFVLSREPLFANEEQITLAGYAESADAYHITSPDPSAKQAAKTMECAIKNASLLASNIDYVSLHGTGTKLNDSMEAKAVSKVLGNEVPASSVKSIIGHTLGASGALAVAVCRALLTDSPDKEGKYQLPCQHWDGVQDEDLERIAIVSKGRNKIAKAPQRCLVNSFAFGGANISLVIEREA